MAVPKKRKTSSQAKQKRSHDALVKIVLAKCPKCGEAVLPHNVCDACGYYGDKKILNVETKLDKKLKKDQKNEQTAEKNK
jgi:large subunit ribosomal protein L32